MSINLITTTNANIAANANVSAKTNARTGANARTGTNVPANANVTSTPSSSVLSGNSVGEYSADLNYSQRYVYPPQSRSYSNVDLDDCTIVASLPSQSNDIAIQESTKSFCERSQVDSKLFEPLPPNILVGTSATDGVGLSTLLSLLAYRISEKGQHVALVDADLTHGGLDVLLGLESDEGRRLQEVDAPLGRCDGYVLCNELVHWDNVDVLAFSPWRGKQPDPWVVEAAIRGLADACDVVIVDIGAGDSAFKAYSNIPQLANSATLTAVELSVLDLARFRAFVRKLNSTLNVEILNNKFATVGIAPRGLLAKSYILSIDEAEEYLTTSIFGVLPYDAHLYADIIGGYGIRNIPSGMKSTIQKLDCWLLGDVMQCAKEESAKCRKYKHSAFSRGKYGRK